MIKQILFCSNNYILDVIEFSPNQQASETRNAMQFFYQDGMGMYMNQRIKINNSVKTSVQVVLSNAEITPQKHMY